MLLVQQSTRRLIVAMVALVVCYPESTDATERAQRIVKTLAIKLNQENWRVLDKTCCIAHGYAILSLWLRHETQKSRCECKHHNGIRTSGPGCSVGCQSLPSVAESGAGGRHNCIRLSGRRKSWRGVVWLFHLFTWSGLGTMGSRR